ncbi:MAG TPA: hypothetical protein VMY87_00215 [Armatimonadota bacterium]|nr:hypothetical protein [Armatimonadota bacterium]
MKLKRLGLPKIIALSAALIMVIAGLVLSRVSGGREAAAPPHASEVAAVPTPGLVVPEGVQSGETEKSPPAAEIGAAKPSDRPAPKKSVDQASSTNPKPAPRPSSRRSLPPLPPPEWGAPAPAEEPSGPPPGVLWLSGVIQGERRVAVLRRGENRYVVREGDAFEEKYRVVTISSNSVTLEGGGSRQTLRVGQY